MEDEIIIHDNQTQLDDYLKEENSNCLTCRWSLNGKCENSANLDEFGKSLFDIKIDSCDYKYSVYDDENLMPDSEEDYEGTLFEDLT